jgi:hypothetical protein
MDEEEEEGTAEAVAVTVVVAKMNDFNITSTIIIVAMITDATRTQITTTTPGNIHTKCDTCMDDNNDDDDKPISATQGNQSII